MRSQEVDIVFVHIHCIEKKDVSEHRLLLASNFLSASAITIVNFPHIELFVICSNTTS